MKDLLKSYLFLFSISGVIIVFDQYTKSLVRANLPMGGVWYPWEWLAPYARIVHWWNTGVAFGMLQGMNTIFAVLAVMVSLGIIYYFPRVPVKEPVLRIAMSMQLGGAVGNLIDRITIGHVTDFVSVGSFAVFNVADASISVGVAILVLGVWLQERRQKKEAQRQALERSEQEVTVDDREASG